MLPSTTCLQAALDSSSIHIVILDCRGIITWGNAAWVRFAKRQNLPNDGIGLCYIDCWRTSPGLGADGSRSKGPDPPFFDQLRKMQEGRCEQFQLDCPFPSEAGENWFRLRATLRIHDNVRHIFVEQLDIDELMELRRAHSRFASPGQVRWVSQMAKMLREDKDHERKAAARVLELTAHHQAELERQQFFALVEGSIDGIAMATLQGELFYLNPAGRRLRGLSPFAPLVGWRIWPQRPGEASFEAEAARIAAETGFWEGESILHNEQSGERIYAHQSIFLVRDPLDQKELCFASICRDISEAKRSEVALRQAKESAEAANRAKGAFIANVSHELRTPMNGVLGMLQVAIQHEVDATQRERLQLAKGSAEALLCLLDDVLDFSKLEAGKQELFPAEFLLRAEIERVVGSFQARAKEKGLGLHCHIHLGDIEVVLADQVRLRQILTNLIGNAIKFTRQGEVTIRARASLAQAAGRLPQAELEVQVADTGIGIEPEVLGRLFRPFEQADPSTTRAYGGTGLGLSIVKQLVSLMGGEVGGRSTRGSGSVFWFKIPLRPVEALAPPPSKQTPPLDYLPRRRILVVDDNSVNQEVTRQLLLLLGQEVEVVADGFLAQEAARNKVYDAILLDLHMPGLDGYTTTKLIRADEDGTGRRTPIFALTALATPTDREACLQSGMDGHLPKPIHITELHALLKNLNGPGGEKLALLGPQDSRLERILNTLGDDVELSQRTLAMIEQRCPPLLSTLKEAVQAGDMQAAHKAAHNLRGLISYIHDDEVKSALGELEGAAQVNNLGGVAYKMSMVCEMMQRLQRELPTLASQLGNRMIP